MIMINRVLSGIVGLTMMICDDCDILVLGEAIDPVCFASPPSNPDGSLHEGFSPFWRLHKWLLGAVLLVCWISCWVVTVSVLVG
ncbi:transmembrane protein, putative [Medicago truncatula]|uniref:Transmembrane protein, putative n=1 Tax=Medicago truncatula TaxID=3880 RepID=G7K2S1_MEDTR|nr:transmembrane protein, putative [Medicago truncatula]